MKALYSTEHSQDHIQQQQRQTHLGAGFCFVLVDIWDLLKLISSPTKKFKREKSFLFIPSKWRLHEHFLCGANHLHWQLMILCLPRSQLLHLANCPSPPAVSITSPLSGLRVFTRCRLCRNSRTESFSVFFPFLPWVNTPIPRMDGDHYRSDSTRGNVSCWIVSP